MSNKGYVVRGKRGSDGAEIAAWTHDGGIGSPVSAAQFRTPGQASSTANALTYHGYTDVRIFTVAEDGTETPLPSYEEALAELDHLRAHAATLPIALAPVPLGDVRPAVMGGKGMECRECRARPPYHEATCSRRTAGDERLAWARYVDAAIDNMEATIAEERGEFRADTWHARTRAALDDAAKALRDLGVDVDALLRAAEKGATK